MLLSNIKDCKGSHNISDLARKNNKIVTDFYLPECSEQQVIIRVLELDEMTVILKRLLKFKYPFAKYQRLAAEILNKGTLQPKITSKNYHKYSYSTVKKLVQLIWNKSIENLGCTEIPDYKLNLYLHYEETRLFNSFEMIKDILLSQDIIKNSKPGIEENILSGKDNTAFPELLKENGFKADISYDLSQLEIFDSNVIIFNYAYPLNINGFLQTIKRQQQSFDDNEFINRLLWLSEQLNNSDNSELTIKKLESVYKKSKAYRDQNGVLLPVELLLLVEGITEEKLLPKFSKIRGLEFIKKGVKLKAAGGKNQVLKLYNLYKNRLKIPILIILDKDAQNIYEQLSEIKRSCDQAFLIPDGEFEDIIPENLVVRAINEYYKNEKAIQPFEIRCEDGICVVLNKLWKEKGYGDFNKSEFADIISENIKRNEVLSNTLINITDTIKKILLKKYY